MDIVTECSTGGINEIYVSSITCNPRHQARVNSINNPFSSNAYTYNFQFIDNSNVKPHHLWKDKIHHDIEGTRTLATNFIEYINRSFMYYNGV